MSVQIIHGDCRAVLLTLDAGSVQCCVTSPPYFGLRSYGIGIENGEMGSEPSPDAYVAEMVAVFREVRRVLRDDGTLWLNLGDSYVGHNAPGFRPGNEAKNGGVSNKNGVGMIEGYKPKDLLGIPWMVAFALRADGWYLRSDIIWAKDSCMPESVADRCTSSHEHVFHLTKRPDYFYDAFAIAEPVAGSSVARLAQDVEAQAGSHRANGGTKTNGPMRAVGGATRNKRSVWRINPEPCALAHFAVMPSKLAETCILAGTSERGCCPACGAPWERIVEKGEPDDAARRSAGADATGGYAGHSTKGHDAAGVQDASAVKARILDGMRVKRTTGWRPTCDCPPAEPVPCTVLDPFAGASTTLLVADRIGRNAVGIELNPDYIAMSKRRIEADAGMFGDVA